MKVLNGAGSTFMLIPEFSIILFSASVLEAVSDPFVASMTFVLYFGPAICIDSAPSTMPLETVSINFSYSCFRGSMIALRIAQKKSREMEGGIAEIIRNIENNPLREASYLLPYLKELIE